MRSFHVCAGIGLHAYGFHRAGVEVAGLNEIDPYCRAVLDKNFPKAWKHDDLRQLTAKSIRDNCGRIDIIEGGVPCQPASVAGKRKGESDSRWLWGEFIRIALDVEACWIVVENVPGFLSLSESERVFTDLEDAGYEVQPYIVGAWAVGAPHKRDRVWIVGHATGARCEQRAGTDIQSPGIGQHELSGHGCCFIGGCWRCANRMADTAGGRLGTDGIASGSCGHADECGEVMAESAIPRLEGLRADSGKPQIAEPWHDCRWPARPGDPPHEWEHPRLTQSNVGGAVNGNARRLAGFIRRNALKAIGNANCWQIPFAIAKGILEEEAPMSQSHLQHQRQRWRRHLEVTGAMTFEQFQLYEKSHGEWEEDECDTKPTATLSQKSLTDSASPTATPKRNGN